MSENPKGSVKEGVSKAVLLHSLQFLMVPAATSLTLLALNSRPRPRTGMTAAFFFQAFWSVTQFLYLGPAAWIAKRKGRTETMKGILIVAAIGVLLNGACDSIFLLPH
jgi:hypothetical protein